MLPLEGSAACAPVLWAEHGAAPHSSRPARGAAARGLRRRNTPNTRDAGRSALPQRPGGDAPWLADRAGATHGGPERPPPPRFPTSRARWRPGAPLPGGRPARPFRAPHRGACLVDGGPLSPTRRWSPDGHRDPRSPDASAASPRRARRRAGHGSRPRDGRARPLSPGRLRGAPPAEGLREPVGAARPARAHHGGRRDGRGVRPRRAACRRPAPPVGPARPVKRRGARLASGPCEAAQWRAVG